MSMTISLVYAGNPSVSELKVSIIYNLAKYIQWPENNTAKSENTIQIGVLGENIYDDSWKKLESKNIKGLKVSVEMIKDFTGIENNKDTLKKYHILVICPSEEKHEGKVIEVVKDADVLTVSETVNFLEKGSILRLYLADNKIAFDINLISAQQARLKINTSVLKLAKRVIQK
ncbi:MAG: YfiR family protein [Sedimentisphaerales bacterium]|nr:YfiR family protein [Sedimentisphaerales bacterium]